MKQSQLAIDPQKVTSDTMGAIASGLCILHCLATPLLFLAQTSAAGHHVCGPLWWGIVDFFFLVISFAAIHSSAKKTSLSWMPFALYFSWAILAIFVLNESFHWLPVSHALLYIPAGSLIFLHLYNRRHCRCETDECCVPE